MNETLRQRAGLRPPTTVNPAKTAVVLIDIQMDYFKTDKLYIPDGEQVVLRAVQLRDWAKAQRIAMVHIQQISPNPDSALFAAGTEGISIHPLLRPREGETVISKTLPSSFDRTELRGFLETRGITTLVLAGLMTHMCVETTARAALSLGYSIIVAADACASRDLPTYDGQETIGHREVHRNALAAMADRFADVMTTTEIQHLSPPH